MRDDSDPHPPTPDVASWNLPGWPLARLPHTSLSCMPRQADRDRDLITACPERKTLCKQWMYDGSRRKASELVSVVYSPPSSILESRPESILAT